MKIALARDQAWAQYNIQILQIFLPAIPGKFCFSDVQQRFRSRSAPTTFLYYPFPFLGHTSEHQTRVAPCWTLASLLSNECIHIKPT
jgi:hypothetical protein